MALCPRLLIILSAGPLRVFPATIGLTPTTGALVFLSSSRIGFTARIGPMLRMGLLGHRTILSAVRIASTMPGAGSAFSAPA